MKNNSYITRMDKSGIYTITNLIDSKIYVGYATNFRKRKGDHFANLKNNKHKNIHLQRAYNKYGKDNFICELIEECEVEHLTSQENYWSNLLDAHNPKRGYNIRPTGIDTLVSHSQETKDKISKSHLGKKLSKETIEKLKIINTGRKHTEKSKDNMREAMYENVKGGCIKLNETQVKEIIGLINSGEKSSKIAEKFGVDRHTISNIKYNKQWKFIHKGIVRQNKSRYSVEQINLVKQKLSENKIIKEISLELNIPIGIIYKIKARPNYGM